VSAPDRVGELWTIWNGLSQEFEDWKKWGEKRISSLLGVREMLAPVKSKAMPFFHEGSYAIFDMRFEGEDL